MLNCIVRGCKSNSVSNPNVHFFNIPKDSFARREWLDILSLRNRQVSESTRVCEKHFKEKDFTSTSTGRKILKHHSVPILTGKAAALSSDDEFMQCNSDSDPEIVEVKKISKQMAVDAAAAAAGRAIVKKERVSPPATPAPKIKQEPQDEEMIPVPQETGRRPSRRAAQLAVKKIHNTVRSLSFTPEKAMEMMESGSTTTSPPKSPARATTPRNTSPRNTSPRAPSQSKAKRRRSGKQSSPPKPKFRDQKVWHSVRAPLSNIGLLMECHEELLSPPQAEALMKAQTEYNNVMRMLRTLKANNFRIILETSDKPETSVAAPTPPPPQVITSPTVIKTQKSPGSFTVKQANLVQTSSSGVTVVPVHLVTVQQTKH